MEFKCLACCFNFFDVNYISFNSEKGFQNANLGGSKKTSFVPPLLCHLLTSLFQSLCCHSHPILSGLTDRNCWEGLTAHRMIS